MYRLPTTIYYYIYAHVHLCTQTYCVGGTTKEYKTKMRTLHFNLKDVHNPDLRAAVLRGTIAPDAFVRMTATELANKELAEYRRQKEEEALKMSVLDAEAAARFSTAAALDARDRLALPAEVVSNKLLAARDASSADVVEPEENLKEGHDEGRKGLAAGEQEHEVPSQSAIEAAERTRPVDASGEPGEREDLQRSSEHIEEKAPTVDWASVKAQAVRSDLEHGGGELGWDIPSDFNSFAELEPSDVKTGHEEDVEMVKEDRERDIERENEDERPYITALSSEERERAEGLARIFKPSPDPDAVLAKDTWTAEVDIPGTGCFYVTVDALAGSGDLSALLGDQELTVRGRLAISKVDAFLSELHLSKHRTATIGIMRPDASSTEEEKKGVMDVIHLYQDRQRTGVIEPGSGIEVYLIPPGDLATRLLVAAAIAEPDYAASAATAGLEENALIAIAIHRLEMRALRGAHRTIKRSRKQTAKSFTTVEAGPKGPQDNVSIPKESKYDVQVPKLPDLSGLTALLGAQVPSTASIPSSASAVAVNAPPHAARSSVGNAPPRPMVSLQPASQQQSTFAASVPAATSGLPAGLDLSAISELAKTFGVASGLRAPMPSSSTSMASQPPPMTSMYSADPSSGAPGMAHLQHTAQFPPQGSTSAPMIRPMAHGRPAGPAGGPRPMVSASASQHRRPMVAAQGQRPMVGAGAYPRPTDPPIPMTSATGSVSGGGNPPFLPRGMNQQGTRPMRPFTKHS